MWNKVYLAAFAILLLPMVFLSYYSGSWLNSIGAPQTVVENYHYYSNLSWNYLWISTIILMILGNVLLWKTRKSWGLWITFLYFAFFIIVRYFWLDQLFDQYQQSKGLAQAGISVEPLIGVVLCVLAAIIVFFDQFLVKRLYDKTNVPLNNTDPPSVNIDDKHTDSRI